MAHRRSFTLVRGRRTVLPLSSSLDAKTLRQAFGHFTTGVAVISCAEPDTTDRLPLGMTVNSLTSVSLDPPLILFCSKAGRTLEQILQTQSFAINYLSTEQLELARHYAGQKTELTETSWSNSPQLQCPWFDGCLAWLECKLHQVVESGDHRILIGQVVSLKIENQPQPPLAFYRGQWGQFTPTSTPA